jgi:hypothetical protein
MLKSVVLGIITPTSKEKIKNWSFPTAVVSNLPLHDLRKENKNMNERKNLFRFSKELNSEPNILGFPGLFVRVGTSQDTKLISRTASQERLEGNVTITEQVTISRTDHGFPNVTDLSVLFYLFDLYATQGYPDSIEVTIRGIAEFLGPDYGQNMRKLVLASLDRLGSASFLWQTRFMTASDSNSVRERFSLLTYRHSESEQRQTDGIPKTTLKRIDKTFVTLAPQIAHNLRTGFSIPIDLESFRSLRLDLAKQLYSWACSRLRLEPDDHMKTCRIPSKQLFRDLSIDGARYKKTSNRRDMLAAAIEQIHMKTVPQGHIEAFLHDTDLDVEMEIKICRPNITITKNTISPYDLVGIFLELWGRTNVEPQSFEISAAQDVLSSFPLEYDPAKKIMETIHQECRRNKYIPKVFNGIVKNLFHHLRVTNSSTPKIDVIQATPIKKIKKEKTRPGQTPLFDSSSNPSTLFDAQLEDEYLLYLDSIGLEESKLIPSQEFEGMIQNYQNELLKGAEAKIFKRMGPSEFLEYAKRHVLRSLAESKAISFNEFVKNSKKK